jgi:hypothetical protein
MMQGRAEEYAKELYAAINSGAMDRYVVADEDRKYSFLDTVAFVWLVAEARKSSPNLDRVREAEVLLERTTAHAARVLANAMTQEDDRYSGKVELTHTGERERSRNYRMRRVSLRTFNSHLASARALLEQ